MVARVLLSGTAGHAQPYLDFYEFKLRLSGLQVLVSESLGVHGKTQAWILW